MGSKFLEIFPHISIVIRRKFERREGFSGFEKMNLGSLGGYGRSNGFGKLKKTGSLEVGGICGFQ